MLSSCHYPEAAALVARGSTAFVQQLHGQAMPNRHFQEVQYPPMWKLCQKAVVDRLKALQVGGIECPVVVGKSIVGWAVERIDEEGIVWKSN